MAVIYPTELPQSPQRNGYTNQQKSNVITSEVDIGEAKKRRRYTDPIINEKWSLPLSTEQLMEFDRWFKLDLASGVNRFTFTDPLLGDQGEYRITDMPTYVPFGTCGEYMVTFNVELLP